MTCHLIDRDTAIELLLAMRGPVDVPRTQKAIFVDEGIDRCIEELRDIPAVSVGVKPLMWENINEDGCIQSAVGFNCVYRVWLSADKIARWQAAYMGEWFVASGPLDAAKAAAQADHEARIRAALIPAPMPQHAPEAGDPECTDCGGTGRTCQTERDCACQPAPKVRAMREDEAALSRFAQRMREKLAASRAKGRDGWQDPDLCPETRLAEMLIGHLSKGNPGNLIDLAILAMMLHERGADPGLLLGALARGDLAQPWRPICEAIKGGPAIWARLHADLSVRTGRPDLNIWDGVQVPLRHPGTYKDEAGRVWDHGWNVAAPVGHGGFPDDWIAGWVPLRGQEADLAWVQSDRTGPAPDW
jgi:hypothetical protein